MRDQRGFVGFGGRVGLEAAVLGFLAEEADGVAVVVSERYGLGVG